MHVDEITAAAQTLAMQVPRMRSPMAAVVGRIETNTGPFTLAELKEMAQAIDRAAWEFEGGAFTGIMVALMLGLEAGAAVPA